MREFTRCSNCGDSYQKPSSSDFCPHCTQEYMAENNTRDDIKPLTEEVLDEMFKKWEKIKAGMEDIFNRGI